MSDIYKALADPTRREILQRLRHKDQTAGELAQGFDMSKPAVTKHLNVLKSTDLVYSEKIGQHQMYSLRLSVLEEAIMAMMAYMSIEPKKKGGSDA